MFPDSQPYVKTGDGDGSVNDVSLNGCELWRNSAHKFDHHVVKKDGEHLKILASSDFLDYMAEVLKL